MRNGVLLMCLILVTAAAGCSKHTAGAVYEDQNVAPPVAKLGPLQAAQVRVTVPRSLEVTERNTYYPEGDINWQEEPSGDRHAQVEKILREGLVYGARDLTSGRRVIVDVQLTRFHALSKKARYTIGGVHAVQFLMTLRDPATNEVLSGPRFIRADFPALGGEEAIEDERRGGSQRARIVAHLAKVIRDELGKEYGYIPLGNGVIGAINQS